MSESQRPSGDVRDLPIWPDPEISVDFDSSELLKRDSESEFLSVALELLKQAGLLLSLPVDVRFGDDADGWTRNDAILIGHLIRMERLVGSVIGQVLDGHAGDLQSAISRQFLDSVATVHYLLRDDGTGSRYDAYIHDSFVAELGMLDEIDRNVAKRSGEVLPIEQRMRASISESFAAAGIKRADIPSRRSNSWPSMENRMSGLPSVVYAAYRTSSAGIHGTFTDLEKNYLDRFGVRFQPTAAAARFAVPTLTMMAQLAAYIVGRYMQEHDPRLGRIYGHAIRPFYDGVHELDLLHEEWVNRRRGQRTGEIEL